MRAFSCTGAANGSGSQRDTITRCANVQRGLAMGRIFHTSLKKMKDHVIVGEMMWTPSAL